MKAMVVELNKNEIIFQQQNFKNSSIFQCKQYFLVRTLYKVVQQGTTKKQKLYQDFFQEIYVQS